MLSTRGASASLSKMAAWICWRYFSWRKRAPSLRGAEFFHSKNVWEKKGWCTENNQWHFNKPFFGFWSMILDVTCSWLSKRKGQLNHLGPEIAGNRRTCREPWPLVPHSSGNPFLPSVSTSRLGFRSASLGVQNLQLSQKTRWVFLVFSPNS